MELFDIDKFRKSIRKTKSKLEDKRKQENHPHKNNHPHEERYLRRGNNFFVTDSLRNKIREFIEEQRDFFSDINEDKFKETLKKADISIVKRNPLTIKTRNYKQACEIIENFYKKNKKVEVQPIILKEKKIFLGLTKTEYTIQFNEVKELDSKKTYIKEDENFLLNLLNSEWTSRKDTKKTIAKSHKKNKDKIKLLVDENRKNIEYGKAKFQKQDFFLEKRKKGIYFRISENFIKNKSQDNIETVFDFLTLKDVRKYNRKTIEEILRLKKTDWVLIYEKSLVEVEMSHPSLISIELKEKNLLAYMTIKEPNYIQYIPDMEEINAYMKKMNISYGVIQKNIQTLLDYHIFNIPILIAIGKPVVESFPRQVNLLISKNNKNPLLDQNNPSRVDFFSKHKTINVVLEGQAIAEVQESFAGIPGVDVFNQVIKPKPLDTKHEVQLGENVEFSSDKKQVLSKITGRPSLEENILSVKSFYEIPGNVNLETGSITFLGDIFIRGSVEDGFSVKTNSNIYVGGFVGKSSLEAGGDIIIKGGIIGRKEVLIKAGKNLYAKFIEKANIEAKIVVVSKAILNSYVRAKSLVSLGKKGIINGGKISCANHIYAKVIGSPTFNDTHIEVGIDPHLRTTLFNIQKRNKAIAEELAKIQPNLINLMKKKKSLGKAFPKDKEMLLEKLEVSERSNKIELEENKIQEEKIRMKMENTILEGSINIIDSIYPGVEIVINQLRMKIENEKNHVSFALDPMKNEIKIENYKEYNFKNFRKKINFPKVDF